MTNVTYLTLMTHLTHLTHLTNVTYVTNVTYLTLMTNLTSMNPRQSPYILYSNGKGNIVEDISLYATGRSGWDAVPVAANEWIELPNGGQLYELPGRKGIGIDVKTGEMRLCEKGWAVAAFVPPA